MPPSIDDFRLRIANIAVGPSTLRNQGAPGVTAAARHFLSKLDLKTFATDNATKFTKALDRETNRLILLLPDGAQNWGTARKALNLFLGEAYYHRFVCEAFELTKAEELFEVPLDRQVADYLSEEAYTSGASLPKWPGIRNLTAPVSSAYQEFARQCVIVRGPGWARIHVDVLAWRRE